jgi:hypothetical protein
LAAPANSGTSSPQVSFGASFYSFFGINIFPTLNAVPVDNSILLFSIVRCMRDCFVAVDKATLNKPRNKRGM